MLLFFSCITVNEALLIVTLCFVELGLKPGFLFGHCGGGASEEQQQTEEVKAHQWTQLQS